MDHFEAKLAKSIIESNSEEGIDAFTKISAGDSPTMIFTKMWIKVWFNEETSNFNPEDLALRSLTYIIEVEMKRRQRANATPPPSKNGRRK